MSLIILDAGSGNTCKNDIKYVERMIDELKAVDTGKHEIVIKWQLFKSAEPNIPLNPVIFDQAYVYAREHGYKTTASVFDLGALRFLMRYDIPFVKIANRPDLYWLAGEVPRKVPVYISVGGMDVFPDDFCYFFLDWADEELACVSEYPATSEKYKEAFNRSWLSEAVSDHTTDFELWHKYQPTTIEWHYKLADSTGLDAGDFARTPAQLAEVL